MSLAPPKVGAAWKRWMGLWLVGLSGVSFSLLLLVQFEGLGLESRAALSTALLLLMEGAFYLGVFLLGKQVLPGYVRSIRRRLRL